MTFTDYVHSHLVYLNFLANACLAWVAGNYMYPKDPLASPGKGGAEPAPAYWLWIVIIRSLCVAVLLYLASGGSISVAIYTVAVMIGFPLIRSKVLPKLLAETELIGNLLYLAGLLGIIQLRHLNLTVKAVGPFAPAHVAAVMLISSIVIYME